MRSLLISSAVIAVVAMVGCRTERSNQALAEDRQAAPPAQATTVDNASTSRTAPVVQPQAPQQQVQPAQPVQQQTPSWQLDQSVNRTVPDREVGHPVTTTVQPNTVAQPSIVLQPSVPVQTLPLQQTTPVQQSIPNQEYVQPQSIPMEPTQVANPENKNSAIAPGAPYVVPVTPNNNNNATAPRVINNNTTAPPGPGARANSPAPISTGFGAPPTTPVTNRH